MSALSTQEPRTPPPEKTGRIVAILTAGTADLPAAEEARVIAEEMGCTVRTAYDFGAAGIHRLFPALKSVLDAHVFIVAAGREGTLPAVVAGLLDRLPNLAVDFSARVDALGRQPYSAHDFFVKYQDRVLFGKDSFQPDEFPYYWRTFETADEYFDYYRDYHALWKLYGLDLPDGVLRKLYHRNAVRLVPGLPRAGLPS